MRTKVEAKATLEQAERLKSMLEKLGEKLHAHG
jgi:hypothetical protein